MDTAASGGSAPASSAVVVGGFLDSKARVRIGDLQEAKNRGEKWTILTCYDTISARIFDHAKIPCLLVGDSAAQTVYGYKSTLPVTMDELIPLVRAVSSSCERALVVADLPFGSYQESPREALRSAMRFMKEAGAHAVKLEGGREYADHVRLLTQSGIPVMAHVGFTPQSEHTLGGYKVQGRSSESTERMMQDARSLEEAGAFACVIEMVPAAVGHSITRCLTIPTVGIGAGPDCDAQVLVWQDMAGFSPPKPNSSKQSPTGYLGGAIHSDSCAINSSSNNNNTNHDSGSAVTGISRLVTPYEPARVPKFVKRYANLGEMLYNAAVAFMEDVRSGAYPAAEHCYQISKDHTL